MTEHFEAALQKVRAPSASGMALVSLVFSTSGLLAILKAKFTINVSGVWPAWVPAWVPSVRVVVCALPFLGVLFSVIALALLHRYDEARADKAWMRKMCRGSLLWAVTAGLLGLVVVVL